MDKYYFVDERPQDVPGYYRGGFVTAAIGTQLAPNINTYMDRVKNIEHGVVHKVRITAENDAYDNASWFTAALETIQRPDWDTLPIVIWLYKSGVNLDILGTYINRLLQLVTPSHKPLIYVTKAMWDGWLKGDNAEKIGGMILKQVDFILADYSPSVIEKPLLADKVEWIESEQGIIYHDPTGLFEGFNKPVDPQPGDPPGDPNPDPDPVLVAGARIKAVHFTGSLIPLRGDFIFEYDESEPVG